MPSSTAYRLRNSWAILPAACLFRNRTRVGLAEIMGEWSEGTILVCETETKRLRFLTSSGDMTRPIGYQRRAHHDQTLADLGVLTVLNVIRYRKVDGKFVVKQANGVGIDSKAPVYVFK